jgi:transposase
MMGRPIGDQTSLFYEFRLDDRIPKEHPFRRIITPVLGGMHEQLASYYSEIGQPSIDPELMVRMLIVGYCSGLRSERKLTQEVELHLAYRWFCRLDLDDKVPQFDSLGEPTSRVPAERCLSPHIRARSRCLHGCRPGQGRRICCRCERDGSRC